MGDRAIREGKVASAQDLSSTRADRPATFDMNQVPHRALEAQCSREHATIPACKPVAVELPANELGPPEELPGTQTVRALSLSRALLLSYLGNETADRDALHDLIQGKMMTRQSIRACASVFALALIQGACAQAQWGYPGGYGGYGWGGWGGQTAQGDIARGLGAYAMGAGYYNQQTAVANSINTDTVMRWNQYVYEAQMNANRLHQGKLAMERFQTNQAADQIRDRLRNNPERADIYRGDAMNVAFDEINNPRVYAKAFEGGKVKLGGELIRNIPFQYAAAAITVSIHQLTNGGPPPSLLKPEFAADREAIKELGQELRKQIEEEKNPDPETVRKMLAAINNAEEKVDKILPANTRDRNE